MQYLYRLNQIQPHHRSFVGDAAYSLGLAAQQKHPVLPGIVVGAPLFLQFLESVHWQDPLFEDFPHSPLHINTDNPHQLQSIAKRIQHFISDHSLPLEQIEEIYQAIASLNSSLISIQPSLGLASTKSSKRLRAKRAIAPRLTAALPLLDAHICPLDRVTIMDAIKRIWSSFFRANHLFYWQQLGMAVHQLRLGLVISPIASALASGTLNVSHEGTIIQAVWGMASGLKNGTIQPDIYHDQATSNTPTYLSAKRYAQLLPELSPFKVSVPLSQASTHQASTHQASTHQASHQASTHQASHQASTQRSKPPSLDRSGSPSGTETSHPSVSLSSPLSSEPLPIQSVYHLLSQQRTTEPVLSDALIQYLLEQTKEIKPHSPHPHPFGWHIEWAIYPTWSMTTSVQAQDPLPPSHIMAWPHSQSTLATIDDETLDLTSLVLERKDYAVYITQILVSPDIAPDIDPEMGKETDLAMPPPPVLLASTPGTSSMLHRSQKNESPSPVKLVGIGTSAGQVVAPLWVMADTHPVPQSLPDNHILLTPSISPIWLNALRGAKGVISTTGGMTCHAAILARELGMPSVMGVTDAMACLQTGDWVCLDGDRGIVTLLTPEETANSSLSAPSSSPSPQSTDNLLGTQTSPLYRPEQHGPRHISTATQLMLSLSQTHQLAPLAQRAVDGIGLIRAEIMLASLLHHQSIQSWLAQENRSLLIQTIYHHIKELAQAFAPRPIWYRTLDMRSHELHFHTPGKVPELNPLLGVHGTMSYRQNPGFFMAELEAIQQLQLEGIRNINLILPFVRTVEEFQFCHHMIQDLGLNESECQVWIMAEVPSILMLLPDYIDAGIQGIAIGSNDLTQLMMATDRTNPMMHGVLKSPHPAVLRAIQQLIITARQANLPCSLCGELASQHPEVIEDLIRWGITTLSVSPDSLERTHREILRAEKRLFLEWGR